MVNNHLVIPHEIPQRTSSLAPELNEDILQQCCLSGNVLGATDVTLNLSPCGLIEKQKGE